MPEPPDREQLPSAQQLADEVAESLDQARAAMERLQEAIGNADHE